jgi:curved DNA-binding protein CbpA
MATQLDYYSILQVHHRAEKEIIDVAYRRLAAKYHPDVSQVSNAEERMKQINIAYEVLSDPVKRAAYDAARGAAPSMDTPSDAVKKSRYHLSARRASLIAAGIALLAVLAVSLGPALLALAPKYGVFLVVVALGFWLIYTLTKPKG